MFDLVPFRRNNLLKRGDSFNEMLNSFFQDDFFTGLNSLGSSFKVDLKETEDQYIVVADLPGINKDGVDVYYENNYLTISAKREDSIEDKKENYVRRERSYGEFRRSFYVDNIDDNSINASFTNGVLQVSMNKLDKSKFNRRKIDIN